MSLNQQNQAQFYSLVEEYRGTCNSLMESDENWLDEQGLLQEFDNEIFECELCGWWCEQSEMSEGMPQVCDDCADEEE